MTGSSRKSVLDRSARAMQRRVNLSIAVNLLMLYIVHLTTGFNNAVLDAGAVESYGVYARILSFVIALLCIYLAQKNFRKDIESVKVHSFNKADKLKGYRSALLSYTGLCCFPLQLAAIQHFLFYDAAILGVTALMLIAIYRRYPLKETIIETLDIPAEEF